MAPEILVQVGRYERDGVPVAMEKYLQQRKLHKLIFTETNEMDVYSDGSSRVLSVSASRPRVSPDDRGPRNGNPTLSRTPRQRVTVQHPQVGAPTASGFAEHVLQHADKSAKLRRASRRR